MNLLKRKPLFPFLLVVFFCLHGASENYGYIGLNELLPAGLLITACVTAFSLIVFLFTKNYVFASLITFFVSLWYLFFGAIKDWISSHRAVLFLQSYSVLVPLLLLATVSWVMLLMKKRTWQPRLLLYLNILLLVYCSIDTFQLLDKYFTAGKKAGPAAVIDIGKVRSRPNVYYLLFDEYPGYQSLKDSFAYRNDSLYDFLRANAFTMLPTFSNYNFTAFSMSSIFNMGYIDPAYNHSLIDQRDIQQRLREIKNGEVFNLFESMGYRVENYSIFDIGGQSGISSKNPLFPAHARLLTDKLLHNRLFRDVGWLLASGRFQIPFIRRNYLYHADINNKEAERLLVKSTTQQSKTPKFCYAHFLLPHGPYFRDSTGNFRKSNSSKDFFNAVNKPAFLSYVKYANGVIRSLVNKMVEHDPTAIIILMSDHGYHSYSNVSGISGYNYDNICAVRSPGGNFIPYKDKWSIVNFFPYLFNCEYGQQMPYLKDSTIWINF